MKMKEYNSHTHLEAYRKLLELFPIGLNINKNYRFKILFLKESNFVQNKVVLLLKIPNATIFQTKSSN